MCATHTAGRNGDMRILFTANPLIGHIYPMLPLMQAARAAGHDVVMATGAGMVPELRARGFRTWTVGPSFEEAVADLQQLGDVPATHEAQLVRDAIYLFARPAVARARQLIPRAVAWRPDLVVSEITEMAGREAAHASGAVAVTHGFGTHIPNLRGLAGVIFSHLSAELRTPDRSHEFDTGIYLDPCPPGLQSDELALANIWPIRPSAGPVTPGDRLPLEFLELPKRPVVYVTLGTVFNDPGFVGRVLAAIQDLPISIAVTTGPAVDPALLGPRPGNVAVARFVPQALVLPYVSAVVSHTGSGTMLGALAGGVPQVCLPQGADQFANAERMQATGAGIRLLPDQVTPDSLRHAVQAVLDDPAYERAAATLQAEIAAMPPAGEVLAELTAMVASAVPAARTA